MRASSILVLGWVACAEEAPPHPGGTHADPEADEDEYVPCRTRGTDGFYEGPVLVHELLVLCHGDTLTVDVCALGWTGGGVVRLGGDGVEVEEHDLFSVALDPANHWDSLILDLATTGEPRRNVSTAWSCEDGLPDLAVRVSEPYGDPADCVAIGAPVAGTEGWGCHPP